MGPLLLLLIQVAAPAAARPVRPLPPQHLSILVDPCASASDDAGRDVVVCGRPDAISPRLPLRDDRGPPDHPVPSNPDGTGIGALAATAEPCALHGCFTGFGPPLVAEAVNGLTKGLKDLKDARARHRDGARRVAIDLDGPPPPIPAGAIRP
jgi:hypothetical protein